MIKVDATLLEQWADRHESWFALPELVRRLVHATAEVRWIDMPAGDCVLYPGWDGIIDTKSGSPWVPDGWSAWEIGTNRDYEAKASDDFRKRLKDTRGIDAGQATYIFVTPRRWPDKQKWIDARKAKSPWKEILIYDGSVLEQWLDQVPQIARWFAADVLRLPEALLNRPTPLLGWDSDALRYEAGPLSWLTWKARLTDLIGRDAEKAELLRWARETGGGVRFRFLVGEGGSGKTRLAHEVAAELAQDPAWAAGLVSADKPLPLDAGLKGCLLLIDYPEEKREAVRERLAQLAAERPDPARPVRVLFLTRHGEEYWQPLVQDTRAYARKDSTCVLPEGVDASDAWEIFRRAVGRVPRKPGAPPPRPVEEEAFRTWIGHMPVNQRPLLIAAAAVETVHEPDRPLLSLTGPQVIVALADREAERLRPLARHHGFDDNALVRLAALAAVRGTLDAETIRRLADPALDLNVGPVSGLIDRLRRAGSLSEGGISAPVPDIVAAAFVVQALTGQDMAPEWLWTVMDGNEGVAIDRLGRLAYDAEFVLGMTGKRFSANLAAIVEGMPDRAARLGPHLDEEIISRGLVPLSAAICRIQLSTASQDDDRARYAANLSVRLGQLGNNAGALAASRQAVEINRRLIIIDRFRFEARLAGSLINLSNRLSAAGDGGEALTAVVDAVAICRQLAEANPVYFEVDLARSLNILSLRLSAVGKGAAVLVAIREAVSIYRRLATANPARFEADLAVSLNNLSIELSAAGERGEALTASSEAVEIRRRLVAASPARFEANLAGSLNNLSNELSAAGKEAEALATSCEAVAIWRRLAAANPARFGADLAMSLHTLCLRRSAAGDRPGALAAIRQGIEVYRYLEVADPGRYTMDLAKSLIVMGLRLEEAGSLWEALASAEEAVRLNEPAARGNPAAPAGRMHAMMLKDLERLRGKCAGARGG